jgi:hypothetical protein
MCFTRERIKLQRKPVANEALIEYRLDGNGTEGEPQKDLLH